MLGCMLPVYHTLATSSSMAPCTPFTIWTQVDGVSSIGALPFKMDAWGVDVAVTGSQKALSLPTGLGLVAVSEKV